MAEDNPKTLVVKAIFAAINKNVFCNNLEDVELMICGHLVSRIAICYQIKSLSKKQTYMRLSESMITNMNRKHLIEVLLYEMLHLYVALQYEDNDLKVYLLKGAMRYLNTTFGTNLILNHTISHDDANHIADVLEDNGKFHRICFIKQKVPPEVKILTKILVEKNQEQFECQINCPGFCYCEPQMIYRQCFLNAKIFAIYSFEDTKKKCLLCGNMIKNSAFDAHINIRCNVVKHEIE